MKKLDMKKLEAIVDRMRESERTQPSTVPLLISKAEVDACLELWRVVREAQKR